MRKLVLGSFLLSVCLALSGCSGGDDTNDGNEPEDAAGDTSTCDRDVGADSDALGSCIGQLEDAGPDGESDDPPGGFSIIGTCLDLPDGPDENKGCTESWLQSPPQSVLMSTRDQAATNCTENDANNEWTRADDVCPKGSDYKGTCKLQAGATYTESHHYAPQDISDVRTGCLATGGNWVVE